MGLRLVPSRPACLLAPILSHVLGRLLPPHQPIQVSTKQFCKTLISGPYENLIKPPFQSLLALRLSLLPGWHPHLLPPLPPLLLPLLPPPGLQPAEWHQLILPGSPSLPNCGWRWHPGGRNLHSCLPDGEHPTKSLLDYYEDPPTRWSSTGTMGSTGRERQRIGSRKFSPTLSPSLTGDLHPDDCPVTPSVNIDHRA